MYMQNRGGAAASAQSECSMLTTAKVSIFWNGQTLERRVASACICHHHYSFRGKIRLLQDYHAKKTSDSLDRGISFGYLRQGT